MATRIDTLTPRQREVLGLVAEGLSDKEIAQHLGIRETSVTSLLVKIYNKLTVNNRTAAAAHLWRGRLTALKAELSGEAQEE